MQRQATGLLARLVQLLPGTSQAAAALQRLTRTAAQPALQAPQLVSCRGFAAMPALQEEESREFVSLNNISDNRGATHSVREAW